MGAQGRGGCLSLQFERPCFQVLALQEAEAKYQNQVAAESILAAVIQSQAIAQNANTGLREDVARYTAQLAGA